MKPTDEERREVAARLRESRSFVDGLGRCGMTQNVLDTFERILECVGYETGNAFDFLADLVEPAPERTCRMANARYTDELLAVQEEVWATPEDTVAFRCGACGFVFRYERGVVPRYCPDCGAKVVG